MQNNIVIKDVNDYYDVINSQIGLFKQIGSTCCYQIEPHFGKGVAERISLRNGVEINIWHINLIRDFEMVCKMEETCFEIMYCAEGRAEYGNLDQNTERSIKANECDCWMNDGGQNWVRYPKRVPWKCVSICYDSRFIKPFLDMASAQYDMENVQAVLERCQRGADKQCCSSPDIELAFYQIMNCSNQGVARLLYLESKAVEIFSLFIHNELAVHEETDYKIFLSQEDRKKLEQAKRIIINNMSNPLSISELSREINLNTYKLKVGFKEMWGTTVFGYLRDMRMEKARVLLSGDRKSVIEVAMEVGYSNPSHFTVAFRRKYGINPHEYANTYKKINQ